MKLLTLNCHSWQEEDQDEKITHLVESIKENAYDVIALQEVNQTVDEKMVDGKIRSDNFALVLLNQLKERGENQYSLVWGFSHYYMNFEEGLAILTKHPVLEEHSFYASKSIDPTIWKARKIVGVTIQYEGKPLSFYSCHMGWWKDEEEPFKAQADNLLKNINRDRVTFLMGDFNNDAFIKGEGYDYLLGQGLLDTYHLAGNKDEGVTVKGEIGGWEGNFLKKRIDLILSTHPVSVIYSKVIFNGKNKSVVSDHYGVEIQVNII